MTLSFKINSELKQVLQELAEKENRSLSNYIVTILLKHISNKGINLNSKKTPSEGKDKQAG